MKQSNIIVIMADEHSRKMLGCYGHGLVQTPNIDALARRGTLFSSAYTPSPLCVPARAAFATGLPVHEIGAWDNAHAYTGEIESWHHRLRSAGFCVTTIGKLHFRGRDGDDYGFSQEIVPMHVVDGVGDALGLIRDRNLERGAARKMAELAGPGESIYTKYDRDISAKAQIWLREEAPDLKGQPWALFVSLVSPHFPLTAPPEYFYRYPFDEIEMPKLYEQAERPQHPYLDDYSASLTYDRFFKNECDVRRAIAGYMGLCTFIDDQVGAIIRSLEAAGLSDSTRIIYTSDHGDNLGARGLWGKTTMYEESAGIPLIISGPDIAQAAVRTKPCSLIDVSRFILESSECDASDLAGVDLFGDDHEPVISQYHGTGSRNAAFMLRSGRWKYVHYTSYDPQLFDLENDPEELVDLHADPGHAEVMTTCREQLYARVNPEEVHQRALAVQSKRIEELGGVEAVIKRGDFGFSPPPGISASYQ